jgi:predicted transcriptional regulator
MNNERVAIRYDFDGYGYQYMDSGSGSDWQTRIEGEFLYSESFVRQLQSEIEAGIELVKNFQEERDELQAECDRLYRIIELNGTLK